VKMRGREGWLALSMQSPPRLKGKKLSGTLATSYSFPGSLE